MTLSPAVARAAEHADEIGPEELARLRRRMRWVLFSIAALGSTMVFLYVRGADERAKEAQAPVQVLKAIAQINPGETLEDIKRRASFSKEDKGLLRDWMAIAAIRAAADRIETAFALRPNSRLRSATPVRPQAAPQSPSA